MTRMSTTLQNIGFYLKSGRLSFTRTTFRLNFSTKLIHKYKYKYKHKYLCSGFVAEKALGDIYEWHPFIWPGQILFVKIDILVKIQFVKINNLNQIREKIILQEEFLEKYDLVDPGLTK